MVLDQGCLVLSGLLVLEMIESKIREEIRNKIYKINTGLSSYMEFFEKPPGFSDKVHEYIRKKAKKDLPETQFSNFNEFSSIKELIEIKGLLGYNDEHIFEIDYFKPELEDIKIKKDKDKIIIECFPSDKSCFNASRLKKYNPEIILDWHTHPVSIPFSDEDFNDMFSSRKILDLILDKNINFFSVLYLPGHDSFYWVNVKS